MEKTVDAMILVSIFAIVAVSVLTSPTKLQISSSTSEPPKDHKSQKVSSADTYFVVEDDNAGNNTNVTCIRRDYEKNISAIFIHQTGPLHTAWNVFNSSIPYGFMTAADSNKIDEKNVLNEFEVDCEDYGFNTGAGSPVLSLCPGLAASLCG